MTINLILIDLESLYGGSSPPITPPIVPPPIVPPPATSTIEATYPGITPIIEACRKLIEDTKNSTTKFDDLNDEINREIADLENIIVTAISADMRADLQMKAWIEEFEKIIKEIKDAVYAKILDLTKEIHDLKISMKDLISSPLIDNQKRAAKLIKDKFFPASPAKSMADKIKEIETIMKTEKKKITDFLEKINSTENNAKDFGEEFIKRMADKSGDITKNVEESFRTLEKLHLDTEHIANQLGTQRSIP